MERWMLRCGGGTTVADDEARETFLRMGGLA